MIEVYGDFWTYPADIKCITTNGYIKNNGEAVMGRGIAYQATRRIPGIAAELGRNLAHRGLHCYCIHMNPLNEGWDLWSFPVKYHWHEKADISLIKQSATELAHSWKDHAGHYLGKSGETDDDMYRPLRILLPRPGCGNGQLSWEEVKPIIEPILDDKFHVITL